MWSRNFEAKWYKTAREVIEREREREREERAWGREGGGWERRGERDQEKKWSRTEIILLQILAKSV